MKQIKLSVLLVFLFSLNLVFAQKAKIKTKQIKVSYERPDFLKTIKSYNYTIQDDGKYWNFTLNEKNYPEDTYPNLTSLTDGIKIEGLEKSTNKADLTINVGFLGNQLSIKNALIEMKGTISIMLINKDKLIKTIIENRTIKGVVTNEFPVKTKADRNKTKAKLLTNYVQKLLDKNNYLFSDVVEEKMPFGLFKKAKGESVNFNTKSESLINEIIANPSDKSILEKASNYWESQLDVDFGKKVKEKAKFKVIYTNLVATSLLNNDLEKAKTHFKKLKEYTGFLDGWKINFKRLINKKEALNGLKNNKLATVTIAPNMAYYFVIDEKGTYTYKKKEFNFSKIEIARFIPSKKSGIVSLDIKKKPNVYIYENDIIKLRYFGDDKHKIVTESGKEIIFKEVKGEFKPYIKTDGGYTLLQ